MKNLENLFNICMNEVKAIGITPGNITCVKINNRAKHRWGQTNLKNGRFTISISDKLLSDEVDDIATKDTIIHEILHTCDGCMNHGENWKYMANKVNKAYSCYNIKRATSSEEKNIANRTAEEYRYNVICKNCGKIFKYDRAGKVVQYPSHYHCVCGGTLFVKCNDKSMQLLTAANKIK